MIAVLYLWKIPIRSLPFAIGRMALDRASLRQTPGITFSKLLGCGKGSTFTPKDVDLQRWGILICIENNRLEEFEESKIIRRWRTKSENEFRALLTPISSRGEWSKKNPFDFREGDSYSSDDSGAVAAITRARLSLRHYPKFLRAIPSVAHELHQAPGLISAIGIGEAPVGLQGTFSIWDSGDALREFAYRGNAHTDAIAATEKFHWYTEELFARFSVKEIRGTL